MNEGENLAISVIVCISIFFVLFVGTPDLSDAIIYNLSDGVLLKND